MAEAVGYRHVIVGRTADGGNSHAAAARLGIPAILIETGQLGDRGPVEPLLAGLHRLLGHLDLIDDLTDIVTEVPEPAREWVWAASVTSPATGLWYPERGTGDDVTEGQLIGRVVALGTGVLHEVFASASGRIFYGLHSLTTAVDGELAAIAVSPPNQEA
jgi:predicted deacylase